MFTNKDIEVRTVFVINCIEHERMLRVLNGELLLEEKNEEKSTVLTKFPFQKILALFIIGHINITTPLIDKCKKFNVALIVVKPNMRPVFYWSDTAEGNFLLRKRQHLFPTNEITIAKHIIENKIENQLNSLKRTRKKDCNTLGAICQCEKSLQELENVTNIKSLLGVEGVTSRMYFDAYYGHLGWNGRRPRTKCDILNLTLDIGYTILFNYIECFLRMFGFDLYVGVYHRLWFKRKSLVCDIMEPFRCIIDHAVLLAFNRKQFNRNDFELYKSEYRLKRQQTSKYYKVFTSELIVHKTEIFRYVQAYYRCFMGCKSVLNYPKFIFR